jgi:hypothetical protein
MGRLPVLDNEKKRRNSKFYGGNIKKMLKNSTLVVEIFYT